MATYTYTTTPAEDDVITWLLAAANTGRATPLTADDLVRGLVSSDLADWGRRKATADVTIRAQAQQLQQDAVRGVLTPAQRATLGI